MHFQRRPSRLEDASEFSTDTAARIPAVSEIYDGFQEEKLHTAASARPMEVSAPALHNVCAMRLSCPAMAIGAEKTDLTSRYLGQNGSSLAAMLEQTGGCVLRQIYSLIVQNSLVVSSVQSVLPSTKTGHRAGPAAAIMQYGFCCLLIDQHLRTGSLIKTLHFN